MGRQMIDDELWEKLQGLLPKPKGRHGTNDRLFLEAIFWMLRTGAPCLANMGPGKPPTTDTIIGLKKAIFRRFTML
jgi:transposase